jgi:hypothetical protein
MMDQLVSISRRKAVFPYAALSQRELLDEKVIGKEHFFDELYGKALSARRTTTLSGNQQATEEILFGELRNHTAFPYRDFYLCLDVVLLALSQRTSSP